MLLRRFSSGIKTTDLAVGGSSPSRRATPRRRNRRSAPLRASPARLTCLLLADDLADDSPRSYMAALAGAILRVKGPFIVGPDGREPGCGEEGARRRRTPPRRRRDRRAASRGRGSPPAGGGQRRA